MSLSACTRLEYHSEFHGGVMRTFTFRSAGRFSDELRPPISPPTVRNSRVFAFSVADSALENLTHARAAQ